MRFFPSRPAQPNPVVVLGERNKIPFRDLDGENREGVGGKKGRKIRGTERRLWGGGALSFSMPCQSAEGRKKCNKPFHFRQLPRQERENKISPLLPLPPFPASFIPLPLCKNVHTRGRKRTSSSDFTQKGKENRAKERESGKYKKPFYIQKEELYDMPCSHDMVRVRMRKREKGK